MVLTAVPAPWLRLDQAGGRRAQQAERPGWGAPERVPREGAGSCLEEGSLLVSLRTLEGNLSPTTSFLYFLEPALLLHLLLLL